MFFIFLCNGYDDVCLFILCYFIYIYIIIMVVFDGCYYFLVGMFSFFSLHCASLLLWIDLIILLPLY